MPRVTIGVPVYNSESLLEQCLENLAAQSFRDLKVIVLDNASTDRTGEIAERFAARDSRFEYRRQPHNKGAMANFVEVLQMADTPYFMWRADDDECDVNFVEEMVRLLEANPGAALAVGRVVSAKRGKTRSRSFIAPWPGESRTIRALRLLLSSRASWIYGVFRTGELKQSIANVRRGYPHFIGFDHLTFFPFLISARVVGSNRATFTQHIIERTRDAAWNTPPANAMMKLRKDFQRYCDDAIRTLARGPLERLALRMALPFYARRGYPLARIARVRWRELRERRASA